MRKRKPKVYKTRWLVTDAENVVGFADTYEEAKEIAENHYEKHISNDEHYKPKVLIQKQYESSDGWLGMPSD